MSTGSRRTEGVEYRKQKNGKVSYRVPWREGGRRTGPRNSYTFDDLDSAKIFRGALVANGFRDPYKNPAFAEMLGLASQPTEVLTFAQVANMYLATLVDVERRTIGQYRKSLEDHFLHAIVTLPDDTRVGPLGRLPIDEFTKDIIQAWVNLMREKQHGKKTLRPYAPKTIINIHGTVVSPVFDYAIDEEYCSRQPCRQVKLPERKGRAVKAVNVITGLEIPEWIQCAYDVDQDTGDITLVLLATGLRWGELTALRVCDVDFDAGTLTVAQVVREDENRRPYIESTEGKSANAFRTITLPPKALEVLRRRAEGRAKLGLLFPAPGSRGGVLWRNANFNEHRWQKVRELAAERGLIKEPTPKGLRHAHASDLISVVGIEPVSKRLGHANVTVTSGVYSHLTPDADSRMAAAIDSTLTGGKTPEIVSEAPAAAEPSNDAASDLPPELTALLTKAIGQALADGTELGALLRTGRPG
ncbi:site-specific integrase [Nonomuraea sp. NPDC026600]|uniref:tyrosine-type recombinase/integrase n=1 Tax=Nonomuraea sp. NPDC026600 TaxID=3155363 RepID=UPI0033CD2B86